MGMCRAGWMLGYGQPRGTCHRQGGATGCCISRYSSDYSRRLGRGAVCDACDGGKRQALRHVRAVKRRPLTLVSVGWLIAAPSGPYKCRTIPVHLLARGHLPPGALSSQHPPAVIEGVTKEPNMRFWRGRCFVKQTRCIKIPAVHVYTIRPLPNQRASPCSTARSTYGDTQWQRAR